MQFWDEERSSFHSIILGEAVGCTAAPSIYADRVDAASWSHDGTAVLFSVPWGDNAYPTFWFDRSYSEPALGLSSVDLPKGIQADLVPAESEDTPRDDYWLRLSVPKSTGWYQLGGRPGRGLRAVDEAELVVDDARAQENEMYGGPVFSYDGTDGRHYAFHVKENGDTQCPLQNGYVVDGVSGEVVVCGHSWGAGALLVDQTAAAEEGWSFELPRPVQPQVCENGMDLRRIWELLGGG